MLLSDVKVDLNLFWDGVIKGIRNQDIRNVCLTTLKLSDFKMDASMVDDIG